MQFSGSCGFWTLRFWGLGSGWLDLHAQASSLKAFKIHPKGPMLSKVAVCTWERRILSSKVSTPFMASPHP